MANPSLETTQIAQPAAVSENPVIQIGTAQTILGIAVIFIGAGIAWGNIRTLVKGVKQTLDTKIEPDLKDVRERFVIVEDRVETIWKDKYAPAHSPRQLNDRGNAILNESGIKRIVDEKKNDLLAIIRTRNIANAYDAEVSVLDVMKELPRYCPDVVDRLKTGAFNMGVSVDVILLVGGLYLRDIIFPSLGFSIDQIDQHK